MFRFCFFVFCFLCCFKAQTKKYQYSRKFLDSSPNPPGLSRPGLCLQRQTRLEPPSEVIRSHLKCIPFLPCWPQTPGTAGPGRRRRSCCKTATTTWLRKWTNYKADVVNWREPSTHNGEHNFAADLLRSKMRGTALLAHCNRDCVSHWFAYRIACLCLFSAQDFVLSVRNWLIYIFMKPKTRKGVGASIWPSDSHNPISH